MVAAGWPSRVLAGLIDLAIAAALCLPAVLVAAVAGDNPRVRRQVHRARLPAFVQRELDRPVGDRSPTARLAFAVARAVLATALRHRRTPGARIVGLRRVAVSDGTPMGASAAVRLSLAHTIIAILGRWLLAPVRRRMEPAWNEDRQRRREAEPILDAIRALYPDDHTRAGEETMKYLKAEELNPFASLAPRLALAAVPRALAALGPNGRTVPDRIAGTTIIRRRSA